MKKFLLASAALVALLGGSASAADLAVKAPYRAAPVPVWSWTGFYNVQSELLSAQRDQQLR